MLGALILWFWFSESLNNFLKAGYGPQELVDLHKMLGKAWFWRMIGVQGLKLFSSMYGLTKISMIFFADACLYAVLLVDEGDNDPKDEHFRQEHGDKEFTLFL